jgi:hypothetical protein
MMPEYAGLETALQQLFSSYLRCTDQQHAVGGAGLAAKTRNIYTSTGPSRDLCIQARKWGEAGIVSDQ